jgi:hypothetical protein
LSHKDVPFQRPATPAFVLLTPKDAAKLLKVSVSWLAKARMRGDGPPYGEVIAGAKRNGDNAADALSFSRTC